MRFLLKKLREGIAVVVGLKKKDDIWALNKRKCSDCGEMAICKPLEGEMFGSVWKHQCKKCEIANEISWELYYRKVRPKIEKERMEK